MSEKADNKLISRLQSRLIEQLQYLRSRWLVLLHDAFMIPFAWMAAYWLSFNLTTMPEFFFAQAVYYIPIVMAIHTLTNLGFSVHRGLWHFISVPDLVRLTKAVVMGTALVGASLFIYSRLFMVPRSALVLHGILLLLLLVGPRMAYRMFHDGKIPKGAGRRVLIVGAGSAGELLARDLMRARPRTDTPVAFVDDKKQLHGREILGVRVLGDAATIPLLTEKLKIDRILIATPSATTHQMQRIVAWCSRSQIPFRTMPKLGDLASGRASASDLRRVEIEDLLGRDPISLNWDSVATGVRGKRVLVTGAGGSIGSELCRQLVRVAPESLVLFERNEFNLYSVGLDLAGEHGDVNIHSVLGDVCDAPAVDRAFRQFQPDIVFHAAAYKHVPLLQEQARESVRNNIVGTRNVADAADRTSVGQFVLISTDKAVNPTSMMGTSKRIAEIYCQALSNHSKTRYVTVRFGNVLGSAGSVVPLFKRQIEQGGPVTVTDPKVNRYFMTTAEACQLILQASVIGTGSEIYVLNMGEPVNIDYLARQMIRLAGFSPGEDIEITYTGLRAGEKLEEELFHNDEPLETTGYDKILLARSRQVSFSEVRDTIEKLNRACDSFDLEVIYQGVSHLVPEYQDPKVSAPGGSATLSKESSVDGHLTYAG